MLQCQDLSLDAPDGRRLVAGLHLIVPSGGTLLLTGPSGSGKSRLLRVLAGTERPAGGTVQVDGVQLWPGSGVLSLLGRVRVGFAFATGGLLSNLSLRDNLALPLRFLGLGPDALRGRVDSALERLGILAVAGLRPHAVSATARRHANLARILAFDPEVILLDDPLEGLEAADRTLAFTLIRDWADAPDKTLAIAQEGPEPFTGLATTRLELDALAVPVESP